MQPKINLEQVAPLRWGRLQSKSSQTINPFQFDLTLFAFLITESFIYPTQLMFLLNSNITMKPYRKTNSSECYIDVDVANMDFVKISPYCFPEFSDSNVIDYPSMQQYTFDSMYPSKDRFTPNYEFSQQLPNDLLNSNDNLADRIFGRELLHGSMTLEQRTSMVQERLRIHDRQIQELETRRNELANRLYFLKRPYANHTPQQINQVEKLLFQLESDQRKEELAFWSDIAEAYHVELDARFDDRARRERFDLLGSLEKGRFAGGA